MDSPTPLSAEELAELRTNYVLAASFMPEWIAAAKRVHVTKSEWLPDWWVGYGKDESCQIEGTPNHWRWLALLVLGLAHPKDAPYSEDKEAPEVIARLIATIDAQAAELTELRAALEAKNAG